MLWLPAIIAIITIIFDYFDYLGLLRLLDIILNIVIMVIISVITNWTYTDYLELVTPRKRDSRSESVRWGWGGESGPGPSTALRGPEVGPVPETKTASGDRRVRDRVCVCASKRRKRG